MDEVALEERLSWDPASNQVMGICAEHSHAAGSLNFDDIAAIVSLKEKVGRGMTMVNTYDTQVDVKECHVAKEVLVLFAQPYYNIHYKANPLLLIPSCGSMSVKFQEEFLSDVIQVWESWFRR